MISPGLSSAFGEVSGVRRGERRRAEGDELLDRGVDIVDLEPDRDRAVRVVVEAEVRRRGRPAEMRVAEGRRFREVQRASIEVGELREALGVEEDGLDFHAGEPTAATSSRPSGGR